MTLYLRYLSLLATSFFMLGCNQQPVFQTPVRVAAPEPKTYTPPPPPKKNIKLKEVEDENFSSEYMYPETKKKSIEKPEQPVTLNTETTSTATMTNTECISMIGQEKFDKYSTMFGGDAGALKKCKMLKAL